MIWRIARFRWRLLFSLALILGIGSLIAAHQRPDKRNRRNTRKAIAAMSSEQLYTTTIKPFLQDRCVRCHGSRRAGGDLRVDTLAALLEGGDHGPALIPGDPENSPLLSRLGDGTMPGCGDPISEKEIILLREWIQRKPAAPANEQPPERKHWAFQVPRLAPVPQVADPAFFHNPIDAFLEQARVQAGVVGRNPPAERRLLLRRVTIDLIGLPPTEAEYRQFVEDASPRAYEKVVDRLLASPRYAERWARHWMDVWRYSSHDERKAMKEVTYGSRSIWRWRDYLIESLQADKGLNRMIAEMLAGDEVARHNPRVLAATGYLVRNYNTLDYNLLMSNTVEHTTRAFLGLTVGCARCHDHKFDPITQRDYYRFRAFFELHKVVEAPEQQLAYVRDGPVRPTSFLIGGNPSTADDNIKIEPRVPAFLGKLEKPRTLEFREDGKTVTSSGRRLALANWLTAEDNPLTARVAVNHIWLRHFGQGLVSTPAEFGLRGQPPTHPALLDWLAVQFRLQGWSTKWLHRLIVTSTTYQMASHSLDSASRTDPDNRLYWRFPGRRLEAEAIRDSILHLGGQLSDQIGGPDVDTELAESSPRRSLYLRLSRVDRAPWLDLFDMARVEECYQRPQSIVPQQSLALLNSTLVWRSAAQLNARLAGRADFLEAGFSLVLGRMPTSTELAAARQFVREQEELLHREWVDDAPARARTYFLHALFNHNDFLALR